MKILLNYLFFQYYHNTSEMERYLETATKKETIRKSTNLMLIQTDSHCPLTDIIYHLGLDVSEFTRQIWKYHRKLFYAGTIITNFLTKTERAMAVKKESINKIIPMLIIKHDSQQTLQKSISKLNLFGFNFERNLWKYH